MKKKDRVPTNGEPPPWPSPFAVLKDLNLPATPDAPPITSPLQKTSRGRVDILRQTAHRGGKTVTVIANFTGVSQPEKEQLARKIQKACGAGGTVKDGRIEIQGEKRDAIARILTAEGFRPVFAGG